jgi:hypothetical protein
MSACGLLFSLGKGVASVAAVNWPTSNLANLSTKSCTDTKRHGSGRAQYCCSGRMGGFRVRKWVRIRLDSNDVSKGEWRGQRVDNLLEEKEMPWLGAGPVLLQNGVKVGQDKRAFLSSMEKTVWSCIS